MSKDNIPSWDPTPANNTDVGGVSIAAGYSAANIRLAFYQIMAQVKKYLANTDTIASSGTIDLGAAAGNSVTISGTTTITALGTVAAGTWKDVTFSDALTLTYDATALILPGGVDITTVAGDTARFESLGSGNWQCTQYTRASGLPIANPIPPPYITGLLPTAISGTSTTAAVTISAGSATDSTGTRVLTGSGHNWAVSNGDAADGYEGGTTLPNSSTIHFYEIWGAGGEASFASTSLTPTLPTGYTYYRRIFSVPTDPSGALLSGTALESEGGALTFYLTTPTSDINATPPTSPRTLGAISVPIGIKVRAFGSIKSVASSTNLTLVTSPGESDTAPSSFVSLVVNANLQTNGGQIDIITDTSGRIGYRSSAAIGTFTWVTRGWCDFRRS